MRAKLVPKCVIDGCEEGCGYGVSYCTKHFFEVTSRRVTQGVLPGTLPKKSLKIYLAGGLVNPQIVEITKLLQEAGHTPFSEWYTPGPEADVRWRDYELSIGFSYREALKRPSAQNTFNFDKKHIDDSDVMLMILPCGKSAHMELGYMIGTGKPAHILMPEEPERWDVMYNFATAVHYNLQEFLDAV